MDRINGEPFSCEEEGKADASLFFFYSMQSLLEFNDPKGPARVQKTLIQQVCCPAVGSIPG